MKNFLIIFIISLSIIFVIFAVTYNPQSTLTNETGLPAQTKEEIAASKLDILNSLNTGNNIDPALAKKKLDILNALSKNTKISPETAAEKLRILEALNK